jgi:hypothetical protein
MGYTILDMQRDTLLACNKALADNSKKEITTGLGEIIAEYGDLPEPPNAAAVLTKLNEKTAAALAKHADQKEAKDGPH